MNERPADFKHIVRVANVDLPGEEPLAFALTNIKGIGYNFAHAICNAATLSKDVTVGNLSNEQILLLNKVVENPFQHGIPAWMCNHKKDYETGESKHLLTGTLTFVVENDLKRLKRLKTLRGVRHIKGLTVRGQRTRSNFRKNKGKVVGVQKKAAAPGSAEAAKGGEKKETKKPEGKKGGK